MSQVFCPILEQSFYILSFLENLFLQLVYESVYSSDKDGVSLPTYMDFRPNRFADVYPAYLAQEVADKVLLFL
jgi:hypothetical protein